MFIAIDIGGTNTRVAMSHNLKDIDIVETFLSQSDFINEQKLIRETIQRVSKDEEVQSISIGVAGLVNRKTCVIESSPNYPTLNGKKIDSLVEGVSGNFTVACANDTELAALGEAVLGAGKNYKRVGYLSLGTGVGGALIEHQKINDFPHLFEPGHQIINFDSDIVGGFGINGSLEAYVSGPSFKKIYKQDPRSCVDTKIWLEYGKKVGIGLHNLMLVWSPDCLVIGGGVSENFDKFIVGINSQLKLTSFIKIPPILKCEFGQGSGIVGGFVLISQLTG